MRSHAWDFKPRLGYQNGFLNHETGIFYWVKPANNRIWFVNHGISRYHGDKEGDETNNMMWMWYWLGYIEIDKGILWEWRWGWYFEETTSTMGILGILGGPTVTPIYQATYCSFAFRKPKGQRGHLSLGTPRATWSMDVTVAWSQLLRGHMMVYVSWMYFGSWVGVGRQKVGR